MFIDTHAHLTDEVFEGRLEEVISAYKNANVGRVINIGYDIASSKKSAYIAQNHQEIYFTAGLHPTDSEPATNENLQIIKELASHPKCVGIGEIGLDYHYGEDRVEQMQKFVAQLALAEELSMPVSIHARDCTADMLSVIGEWAGRLPAMVLHCYSLGAESAKQFAKYGCDFSFGGAITFKNNKQIYDVVKVIPMDRILTETDCPYMTPVPHRGERNEPKFVGLVTEKLADLYGVSIEEMKEAIIQNTNRIFKTK